MLPAEERVYVGKEASNLFLEELEKSDSEGQICAKLAGSCLTAAVYFIVHIYFTVKSVRASTYRNRHGGVQNAAVVEMNISRV